MYCIEFQNTLLSWEKNLLSHFAISVMTAILDGQPVTETKLKARCQTMLHIKFEIQWNSILSEVDFEQLFMDHGSRTTDTKVPQELHCNSLLVG